MFGLGKVGGKGMETFAGIEPPPLPPKTTNVHFFMFAAFRGWRWKIDSTRPDPSPDRCAMERFQ